MMGLVVVNDARIYDCLTMDDDDSDLSQVDGQVIVAAKDELWFIMVYC